MIQISNPGSGRDGMGDLIVCTQGALNRSDSPLAAKVWQSKCAIADSKGWPAHPATWPPPCLSTLTCCPSLFGRADWYAQGRTKEVRPDYPNLMVPHRIKALEASGGRASSSICGRHAVCRRLTALHAAIRRAIGALLMPPSSLFSPPPPWSSAGHQGCVCGSRCDGLPHRHR